MALQPAASALRELWAMPVLPSRGLENENLWVSPASDQSAPQVPPKHTGQDRCPAARFFPGALVFSDLRNYFVEDGFLLL